MANNVYLACYHGRADKFLHRLCDGITKFFTRGKYSHCEIAVKIGDKYLCYSSSVRDGGVRVKTMDLPPHKWDLVPLTITHKQVQDHYLATIPAGYDLLGALGSVALFKHSDERYFCSEWCFNAIFGTRHGWRFSPSDLYDLLERDNE